MNERSHIHLHIQYAAWPTLVKELHFQSGSDCVHVRSLPPVQVGSWSSLAVEILLGWLSNIVWLLSHWYLLQFIIILTSGLRSLSVYRSSSSKCTSMSLTRLVGEPTYLSGGSHSHLWMIYIKESSKVHPTNVPACSFGEEVIYAGNSWLRVSIYLVCPLRGCWWPFFPI